MKAGAIANPLLAPAAPQSLAGLFDGDPVAQLRKVEDSYRAISRELLLEEWLARPKVAAYVDNVLR